MESRCSLKSIKGEENVLRNGVCGDKESEQWRAAWEMVCASICEVDAIS